MARILDVWEEIDPSNYTLSPTSQTSLKGPTYESIIDKLTKEAEENYQQALKEYTALSEDAKQIAQVPQRQELPKREEVIQILDKEEAKFKMSLPLRQHTLEAHLKILDLVLETVPGNILAPMIERCSWKVPCHIRDLIYEIKQAYGPIDTAYIMRLRNGASTSK